MALRGYDARPQRQVDSANWDLINGEPVAGPPATYTFTTPGTYKFFCQLHATPDAGRSGDRRGGHPPPPPPPPPLSEQPFPNDYPGPTVLEVRDTVAPTLDRVTVTRARKAAKVRVRLSEAGKVAVEPTRGKLAKRRTVEVAKGHLLVHDRRPAQGHLPRQDRPTCGQRREVVQAPASPSADTARRGAARPRRRRAVPASVGCSTFLPCGGDKRQPPPSRSA